MSSKVRVAIAVPMADELVRQIAAVDDRVEVVHDAAQFPGDRYLGDHHGFPARKRSDDERDQFFGYLSGAEVVYGVPELRPDNLVRLVDENPALRWVHAIQAGAGSIVTAAGLRPEQLEQVTFTSSAGVHAEPLAEFAMLGLLAGSQDLARLKKEQAEHVWGERRLTNQLNRATCLIVGAGEIGKAVAVRAKAFGMRTVGLKRTVEPVEHFDEIVGTDQLRTAAADADYIVITLPGTEHTEGLVDADVLAACKKGVVIVNVGRGTVIDEAALIDALRSGQVGSAALDVFEQEPLDSSSPLWDLPNVIVSPHTATLDTGEEQRVVDLFCANLRRYLDGERLKNIVDPAAGY